MAMNCFCKNHINRDLFLTISDWALTSMLQLWVLVDKVCFGDDDGAKPYIECGN